MMEPEEVMAVLDETMAKEREPSQRVELSLQVQEKVVGRPRKNDRVWILEYKGS